jgi:hypothetical protein
MAAWPHVVSDVLGARSPTDRRVLLIRSKAISSLEARQNFAAISPRCITRCPKTETGQIDRSIVDEFTYALAGLSGTRTEGIQRA